MAEELLNAKEHEVLELTVELSNALTEVVGRERGISDAAFFDLTELRNHIHAIQNAVLANAASRAYPDKYRLLGTDLTPPE